MGVTMKDIAERCNVSKTLVSRILNEDPTLRVTPETRTRVLQAIEEMGYVRNVNALALYTGRVLPTSDHPRIGCITFTAQNIPGHPYFSRIVEGIVEEASRMQAQVSFCLSIEEFSQRSSLLIEQFQSDPIEGLILLGKGNDALKQVIKKIAKNVICIDEQFDKNSDYVGVNTAKSLLLVLEHIHRLGYTDIGLLTGVSEKRHWACQAWLTEHGLEPNANWVLNGCFSMTIAYKKVSEMLKKTPPPRVIVAYNDEMAVGCVRALKDAGWNVPEDVAVTGHDDISLAACVDVPLTTVRVYKKEIGRMAVKLLVDRWTTKRKCPFLLEIPGKLVKRDSCGWKIKK